MTEDHKPAPESPASSPGKPASMLKKNPLMLFVGGIVLGALVIAGGGYLWANNNYISGDDGHSAAVMDAGSQKNERSFFENLKLKLKGSVAKVNGQKISYTEYVTDLETLDIFLANTPVQQQALTDEEKSDQVLSTLIVRVVLEQLAEEFDVSISEEEISERQEQMLAPFGTEEAALEALQARYNWTVDDFRSKVAGPTLLSEKVTDAFVASDNSDYDKYNEVVEVDASHILFAVSDEDDPETVRAEAQAVLDELQAGADFTELAKIHSDDPGSAVEGGALGAVGRGAWVQAFEEAAFALEPGQMSGLVQSQFGYHIILVNDNKMGRDKSTFEGFLVDVLRDADIKIFHGVNDPMQAFFDEYEAQQQAMPVVEEGGEPQK